VVKQWFYWFLHHYPYPYPLPITPTTTHYPRYHHHPVPPPTCRAHDRAWLHSVPKWSTRLLLESTNTVLRTIQVLNRVFSGFTVLHNERFSSAVTPGRTVFLKWTRKYTKKPLFYYWFKVL